MVAEKDFWTGEVYYYPSNEKDGYLSLVWGVEWGIPSAEVAQITVSGMLFCMFSKIGQCDFLKTQMK